MAGVADHDGDVHAFGHQPEHHLDAVGCGLEIVEWVLRRQVKSFCSLAAEVLDVVLDAALAVADEGMHLVIGDAEVVALRIEAGETGGADLFLASSSALAFA